jgi:hypothetical protein
MNRAAMRLSLRRRLQETDPDRWQDTDLDQCLNLGLVELQKEILKVDPEAFSFVDRMDLVAGQEFYEFPAGTWYEREIRLQATGSPLTYGPPLRRVAFLERTDPSVLAGSSAVYARFDRSRFVISPIPSASVVSGAEMVWVPTLTMALDTSVPPVHLGLHLAVVEFAEVIATADVGDTTEETLKDLARIINSIPQYYLQSAGTPTRWTVAGIDKEY